MGKSKKQLEAEKADMKARLKAKKAKAKGTKK